MKLILIAITSLALIGCGPNNIIQRTFNGPDPKDIRIVIEVGAFFIFAIIGHIIIRPKRNATRSYFNRFRYLASWFWFVSAFSAKSQATALDPDINPRLLFYVFHSFEFWGILITLNLVVFPPIGLIVAKWFPKKTDLGATLREQLGFTKKHEVPPIVKNTLSNKTLRLQGLEDFKYYEIASNEFDSGSF